MNLIRHSYLLLLGGLPCSLFGLRLDRCLLLLFRSCRSRYGSRGCGRGRLSLLLWCRGGGRRRRCRCAKSDIALKVGERFHVVAVSNKSVISGFALLGVFEVLAELRLRLHRIAVLDKCVI